MPEHDESSLPSLTVVVSAHNESRNIEMCVDSLLAQQLLPEAVIIVDDGSTDDTVAVLDRYADNSRVRVIALSQNVGVPGARNAGVAESQSGIVVFFDADAFAPPDWLATLTAPFTDSTIAATGGPDRAPESDSPFALAVDYSLRSWIATGRLRLNNPFMPFAPAGCNFAIRRETFNELGGFDVRLDRRGEEKELIQRLRRNGHRIDYCGEAAIRHHRRVSPKQFWRQNFLSGRARLDILRLAPDAFALPHMVPAVLVLTLLSAGLFAIAGTGAALAIGVLSTYGFLLLIDGLIAASDATFRRAAIWVPVTTATIHWGYGVGLLTGALRWLLGRPVGSGSVRTGPLSDAPSRH